MKKISLLFFILSLLAIGCQNQTANQVGVTIDDFDSCVQAGNPVMESYPRQCRHQDKTFTEIIVFDCQASDRQAEACNQIYDPVCATINVQCFKAPCPTIKQTFGNACEACRDILVDNYTKGECPAE